MRRLYTAVLYLLLPLVFLRLMVKGLRLPGYRRRWGERLGYFPHQVAGDTLWIHAVSVGEALAAIPLIHRLRKRYPHRAVVLTTTTPTGSARVSEQLGGEVLHAYVPYDLPWAVARFLRRARPTVAVMMETELWPNLFHHCQRAGIPVVIANARLSERSARRYLHVARLARQTLRTVTAVGAQSAADAGRFVTLGAAAQTVQVCGNIKFDIAIPATVNAQAAALRGDWGANRPVWIAASTHEGEEEQVLAAHAQVCRSLPDALLVLVPRHPERFARVAGLCRKRGGALVRRSEGRPCPAEVGVFLGDTMGELLLFYAAADCAFVGGSLVARGGHNPLEPAALGLPALFGPHMFNFREISTLLVEAGAAATVTDATELGSAVTEYLCQPARRRDAGERGQRTVEENRGALDRLAVLIEKNLPDRP